MAVKILKQNCLTQSCSCDYTSESHGYYTAETKISAIKLMCDYTSKAVVVMMFKLKCLLQSCS